MVHRIIAPLAFAGWMQDMEMQSQLAGKGKKKKVKNGKDGKLPTYKWNTVRKR